MAVDNTTSTYFGSGPISFSELRKVFIENTTVPVSLSQLYRDTNVASADPIVPDATQNANVPTSGTIDTSDFRNTLKAFTLTQTGTDENLKTSDHISKYGAENLSKNIRKNFVIQGTLGSKDRTKPALTIDSSTSITNFGLVNSGNIYGAGGSGQTNTIAATTGGDAIVASTTVKIINYGNVYGGGGGGGLGGKGGTGGKGGSGNYQQTNSSTCYTTVSATCYYTQTNTSFSTVTYSCPVQVSYTYYYSQAGSNQCKEEDTWGGTCNSNLFTGKQKCNGPCNSSSTYFVARGNGKMQSWGTVYVCNRCTQPDNKQVAATGYYSQAKQCSYQQSQTTYSQISYTCYTQQSYTCYYTTTVSTSGGSGGSGGNGGSGGRGRGYDYQSPSSLSGSSGSSGADGAGGGTNAGTGGKGGTGGTGGSGGDWGDAGSTGETGTTGSTGTSGNVGSGAAGASGSSGSAGASAGNYLKKGSASAQFTNSGGNVKGNTA